MAVFLFFIKQLSPMRGHFLLGILLSLLLAFSSVALLTLSGWFIAASAFAGLSTLTASSFNYFIPAGVIRLLAFTRILSRYADRLLHHDIILRILAQLRVRFYEALLPLSPALLLSESRASLLNQLTQDIDTLDHAYLNTFSPLLITLIITASSLFFSNFFSSTATWVMTLTAGLSILLCLFVFLPNNIRSGGRYQNAIKVLRGRAIDYFQARMDGLAITFGKQQLKEAIARLLGTRQQLARQKGLALASMHSLSSLAVVLLIWYCGPLVNTHHLSGAILIMLVFLTMAMFEYITSLALSVLHTGKALFSAKRLHNTMTQTPTVSFPEESSAVLDYSLSLKNITFSYPERKRPVFQQFSLDIPYRIKLGISGPSGAGKSTLGYLLTRVWDPQAGSIYLGNSLINQLSEEQLRNTITLIIQQPYLFNTSVYDNLTLGNHAVNEAQCWEVLRKVLLNELIQELPQQLHTPMGEFGRHFSGGQTRRIAIARALLFPTPILILDEPSAGLEKALTLALWDNCQPDFQDRTVIVCSHDEVLLERMDDAVSLGNV